MKVLLLAAGKGERLRPLTNNTPKCMLRVEKRPLLEHWVEKLAAAGFRDIAINLHYLPDCVTSYFGTGTKWGVNIHYSIENELLGTGGAIKKLQRFFEDAPFMVIFADNLSDCNLQAIRDFHEQRKALMTMAVCWIEDPTSCGIVGFNDDGRIRQFLEKPKPGEVFSNYINAGIYVFDPKIFDFIPAAGYCDLSLDVLPHLLAQPIYAFSYPGRVLKFDTPADWERSGAMLEEAVAGCGGNQDG